MLPAQLRIASAKPPVLWVGFGGVDARLVERFCDGVSATVGLGWFCDDVGALLRRCDGFVAMWFGACGCNVLIWNVAVDPIIFRTFVFAFFLGVPGFDSIDL